MSLDEQTDAARLDYYTRPEPYKLMRIVELYMRAGKSHAVALEHARDDAKAVDRLAVRRNSRVVVPVDGFFRGSPFVAGDIGSGATALVGGLRSIGGSGGIFGAILGSIVTVAVGAAVINRIPALRDFVLSERGARDE